MPRATNLPIEINNYNFIKLARQERHACTRERLLGMAHLQEHGSLTKTSKALFVSVTTVCNWLNRFRASGIEGLKEKSRAGRPSKLDQLPVNVLETLIEQLINASTGGRIKGKDIQNKLSKDYGINYHLNALYHVLKRQQWSWITSRSMHPDADRAAQETFKKLR